jgi:hypothetical protein
MDFFWSYVKNILYGEKIRDLRQLGDGITAAITTVTPYTIWRTWHEIELSLHTCRARNGPHIETYYETTKLHTFHSNLTLESYRYTCISQFLMIASYNPGTLFRCSCIFRATYCMQMHSCTILLEPYDPELDSTTAQFRCEEVP